MMMDQDGRRSRWTRDQKQQHVGHDQHVPVEAAPAGERDCDSESIARVLLLLLVIALQFLFHQKEYLTTANSGQ
jgi:hypothetical protein